MQAAEIPDTMQAMVMERPQTPLVLKTVPTPVPGTEQVLIKVIACGICRTDLHILDGELTSPVLPLIPGHEVIGEVVLTGTSVKKIQTGDIVGIPWLAHTCGHCKFCSQGQENLCEHALFTGYTVNGGYAEYILAWEDFCIAIPPIYANSGGAPLLCAGLIGYRCLHLLPEHAINIGIYGFGAAAHIITQIAKYQFKSIYAFTRPQDGKGEMFAMDIGAVWAGSSLEAPPIKLDAAIIFAPDGSLVPIALSHLDKGGAVICGGIHMSDIPGFTYESLWQERMIRSVANLTREDGKRLFEIAPKVPVTTTVHYFSLAQANEALTALRTGQLTGAAVLVM
ncbi:MAG: zinc-dependent alcohol dehydrogenase family protein [Chitinophaga sp.]|uniref:zinc-dependent alcohol dehydrogenase family protein n=1 Tax=Chitinophaga sp. TaxID=1869181 RepID=UPI0025BB7DEF|nr:zinc-dependent alcohol dehydrogenase family protein [Chitinophaga sp.]MBV8253551.1 zinc-dependent alcohol dehydrogenase family protein [Chitinophaga sp.]